MPCPAMNSTTVSVSLARVDDVRGRRGVVDAGPVHEHALDHPGVAGPEPPLDGLGQLERVGHGGSLRCSEQDNQMQ